MALATSRRQRARARQRHRTMLVASPGGHLDELRLMVDLLDVDVTDAVWVTGKTSQTESLLVDHEVVWLPRVGSGEALKAVRGVPRALDLQRRLRPDLLVTTGALFSTPHLLAATVFGCETWFIDSATRVEGPSSTGSFARRFTRARLFAQGKGWGDPRWSSAPSIFEAFEAVPAGEPDAEVEIASAVVSLGTELWPFERAVRRTQAALGGVDVYWQTGVTEASQDGRPLRQWAPAAELHAAFGASDVVVIHAGVGSALVALEHGKVPVLLPRRAAHREMVDDHQVEFAEMMAARGLAVVVDPDELAEEHLRLAASRRVRKVAGAS